MREIFVRLRHGLDGSSETVRVENDGEIIWGVREYLMAGVYHALVGEPHPLVPKSADEKAAAKAAAEEREREVAKTVRAFAQRNRRLQLEQQGGGE